MTDNFDSEVRKCATPPKTHWALLNGAQGPVPQHFSISPLSELPLKYSYFARVFGTLAVAVVVVVVLIVVVQFTMSFTQCFKPERLRVDVLVCVQIIHEQVGDGGVSGSRRPTGRLRT